MAASYNGNPQGSAVDRLRFYVGDTDVNNPLLQDAEYQYIIDQFPDNENKQLAAAFRAAATAIAIKATKRSLGPQSEDNTTRLNYYAQQADRYEKAAAFSKTPPSPDYAAEKVFSKGMMANEA